MAHSPSLSPSATPSNQPNNNSKHQSTNQTDRQANNQAYTHSIPLKNSHRLINGSPIIISTTKTSGPDATTLTVTIPTKRGTYIRPCRPEAWIHALETFRRLVEEKYGLVILAEGREQEREQKQEHGREHEEGRERHPSHDGPNNTEPTIPTLPPFNTSSHPTFPIIQDATGGAINIRPATPSSEAHISVHLKLAPRTVVDVERLDRWELVVQEWDEVVSAEGLVGVWRTIF